MWLASEVTLFFLASRVARGAMMGSSMICQSKLGGGGLVVMETSVEVSKLCQSRSEVWVGLARLMLGHYGLFGRCHRRVAVIMIGWLVLYHALRLVCYLMSRSRPQRLALWLGC